MHFSVFKIVSRLIVRVQESRSKWWVQNSKLSSKWNCNSHYYCINTLIFKYITQVFMETHIHTLWRSAVFTRLENQYSQLRTSLSNCSEPTPTEIVNLKCNIRKETDWKLKVKITYSAPSHCQMILIIIIIFQWRFTSDTNEIRCKIHWTQRCALRRKKKDTGRIY